MISLGYIPKVIENTVCKAFSITVNAQDLIKEQLCVKFFVITCRFCDSCVIYMFTCQHVNFTVLLIDADSAFWYHIWNGLWYLLWVFYSLKNILFIFLFESKSSVLHVCLWLHIIFFFVLTFERIIYIKLTTPPLLAVYFFLAAKVYQLLIILLFNLVVEIQLWINHK